MGPEHRTILKQRGKQLLVAAACAASFNVFSGCIPSSDVLPALRSPVSSLRDNCDSPSPYREMDSRVAELARIGKEAIPDLIKLLEDNEECTNPVRIAAAKALGEIGDMEAKPTLIKMIKQLDEDKLNGRLSYAEEDLRREVICALGNLGKEGDEAIIHILAEEAFRKNSGEALEALIEIGTPAVPALIESLRYCTEKGTGESIAYALMKIGDDRAIPVLAEAAIGNLDMDPDDAIGPLKKFGESAVDEVAGYLKNGDPKKQKEAIIVLGNMRLPEAVPPLTEFLLNGKDWELRMRSVDALEDIYDPGAASALGEFIVRGLSEGNLKAAYSINTDSAEDNEKHRDYFEVMNLLELFGAPSVPVFTRLLSNPQEEVVTDALYSLEKSISCPLFDTDDNGELILSGPRKIFRDSVPALIDLVKNGKQVPMAVDVLAKIRDPKAIEALTELAVSNASLDIRKKAAVAIREIADYNKGAPEVVEAAPVLVRLTQAGNESDIRAAAAAALGGVGTPEAVKILVDLALKDKEAEVRSCAVSALGNYRDDSILPVLIRIEKKDPDEKVRKTASDSIEDYNHPE